MWIQELILENFKSYAGYTKIGPFDKQFNAITGLNGSGKSNILDAICFVLGLQNTTQMRARNLQELIYKGGDVHKASVTAVFNNTDEDASPVSFRGVSPISVTRIVTANATSYLVNGKKTAQTKVLDMFRSVQININNPHFLIMQGRVTKVVNMRPLEVLSMMEEAAGTRLFEDKKQATLRILAQKDLKIEQIDRMMTEEITPKIERLRQEQDEYKRYQVMTARRDQLAFLLVAHRYWSAERACRETEADARLAADAEAAEAAGRALAERAKEVKAQIAAIRKREEDKKYDAELRALEKAFCELDQAQVRLAQGRANALETLAQERERRSALDKSVAEAAAEIEALEKQAATLGEERAAKEAAHAEAARKLSDLQRAHEAASLGVSVGNSESESGRGGGGREDGSGKDGNSSAADTLLQAQQAAADARAEVERLDMEIAHTEAELRAAEEAAQRLAGSEERLAGELRAAEERRDRLREALGREGFDPARLAEVRAERARVQSELRGVEDEMGAVSGNLTHLQYADPSRSLAGCGIDTRRIRGVAAELITVAEPKYYTALETVAGAKLYNVVTDDVATSKRLIDSRRLTRRVTFIPLAKIVPRTLPPRALQAAERLGGRLALSLVGYSDDVAAAIRYIFGSTFVCDGDDGGKDGDKYRDRDRDRAAGDKAKAIAFNDAIRTRCVTVAGDVFDPSGLITGGYNRVAHHVLADLARLNDLRDRANGLRGRLDALAQEADALAALSARCASLQREYDLAAHQCELAQQRLAAGEHRRTADRAAALRRALADARERRAAAVQRAKAAEETLEERRRRARELSTEQGRRDEIRRLERQIAAAKKAAAAAEAALTKVTQAAETLGHRLDALRRDRTGLVDSAPEADAAVAAAQEAADAAEGRALEAQSRAKEAKERVAALKAEIAAQSEELKALLRERDEAQAAAAANAAEVERLRKEREGAAQRRAEAERLMKELRDKYRWIQSDRKTFGKPGSKYDWSSDEAATIEGAKKALADLNEKCELMDHTVNKKSGAEFDARTAEYEELVKKKHTVQRDKATISATIAELDRKKKLTLNATWHRISASLSDIFRTLLPGAEAALSLPPGGTGDVTVDGLELKVSLGGVTKKGLTELSGGQRSLLALSLILALLRFKPAPVYILDEVDAALDPSHTQNIGGMLAKYFKNSQFLIVSLKKEMWANATVLFKCECINGRSVVSRDASRVRPDREADFVLGKRRRLLVEKHTTEAGNDDGDDDDDDSEPTSKRQKKD